MMCVPIAAVLHVLNYKHVDLVALDTETTEPHILVCLAIFLECALLLLGAFARKLLEWSLT